MTNVIQFRNDSLVDVFLTDFNQQKVSPAEAVDLPTNWVLSRKGSQLDTLVSSGDFVLINDQGLDCSSIKALRIMNGVPDALLEGGNPGEVFSPDINGTLVWAPSTATSTNIITGNISKKSGTTSFPDNNNIPLITSGTEIWSAIFTPTTSTAKVQIQFAATVDTKDDTGIALFRGLTCIASTIITKKEHTVNMAVIDIPNSTSQITYSARIGVMDDEGSWYVNRLKKERFGNTMQNQSYIVEEVGN